METRYFLGKDFLTDNDEDINYFNNEIKERGYCDRIGLQYRVYSGKLVTLFIAENLSVEVEEMGERKLVPIQGKDFADAYQSEYDRGKAWFNQTYPLANLLSNTEMYIPRLRKIYFHDRFRGTIFPGLRGFKGLWANPITVEWVKQIGYHSGIIAEMERLDELHLPLFTDLEQWQHGEAKPEQQTIILDKKPDLTARQSILKYFYEGGKMMDTKDKRYNKYILFCTPSKRLAYPNRSQSKLKPLIRDIGKVIKFLSGTAKQQAETELNTLIGRLTVEN